jgi:hypothetical protein
VPFEPKCPTRCYVQLLLNQARLRESIVRIRLIAVTSVVLLALGFIAPPAQAATKWHEKAWLDMRSLARVGAIETGRNGTLVQIQRTCRYLDSGYSASSILDNYIAIASQSAADRNQFQEMNIYNFSIMVVAVKRLCPRHTNAVIRALNR